MKLYKSESAVRPFDIDAESSPTTVYVNQNIQEIQRADEMTGETQTIFTYDVREFTKQEYSDLITAEYILDLEMQLAGE